MRHVVADDIDFSRPGTRHREGAISFKYLLRGSPGSPQNYEYTVAHSGGGFPSPPHHHNFDQIRFGLRGAFGDGHGLDVLEGQCGYYPEGGWYSIDAKESEVLLLQFGGATGIGYTSYPQLFEAYAELARLGEFSGGRFQRSTPTNGEPPAKSQDGYEALWEHINGRPVVYPTARYSQPVIMNPGAFGWSPVRDGVDEKVLGIFTERAIQVRLLKVQPGAAHEFPPQLAPQVLYILSGSGQLGDEALRRSSAAEIARQEPAVVRAVEELTIFSVKLPSFRDEEISV